MEWRPDRKVVVFGKTTGEDAMGFISIVVILLVLYVVISLRVLRQYERGVVFLLGKFAGVRGPGLTLIFIPIQQMVRVSLRTVTMQIPSQKIITRDNVSIDIAAVAYYHITDPERAVIAIENVYNAINQISQTTVRNVVGRFSLDQLLSDTASINEQIKNVIDRHTEPRGRNYPPPPRGTPAPPPPDVGENPVQKNSDFHFPAQIMTTVQEAIALMS